MQPLTHFVADRPASLVVEVDVVRDSAVGFHFAALSVRPHEALSHRVGKCFARHGTIARVSYAKAYNGRMHDKRLIENSVSPLIVGYAEEPPIAFVRAFRIFAGSAPIAAHKARRRARAIELDPRSMSMSPFVAGSPTQVKSRPWRSPAKPLPTLRGDAAIRSSNGCSAQNEKRRKCLVQRRNSAIPLDRDDDMRYKLLPRMRARLSPL